MIFYACNTPYTTPTQPHFTPPPHSSSITPLIPPIQTSTSPLHYPPQQPQFNPAYTTPLHNPLHNPYTTPPLHSPPLSGICRKGFTMVQGSGYLGQTFDARRRILSFSTGFPSSPQNHMNHLLMYGNIWVN